MCSFRSKCYELKRLDQAATAEAFPFLSDRIRAKLLQFEARFSELGQSQSDRFGTEFSSSDGFRLDNVGALNLKLFVYSRYLRSCGVLSSSSSW